MFSCIECVLPLHMCTKAQLTLQVLRILWCVAAVLTRVVVLVWKLSVLLLLLVCPPPPHTHPPLSPSPPLRLSLFFLILLFVRHHPLVSVRACVFSFAHSAHAVLYSFICF